MDSQAESDFDQLLFLDRPIGKSLGPMHCLSFVLLHIRCRDISQDI